MTADTAFHLMALNNAWANATFYAALDRLPEEKFDAPAPGFFGSLKETLTHIWQVDLFYLDALDAGGLGRSVFDRPVPDLRQDLAAAQAATDLRFARFCQTLTDRDLSALCMTQRRHGMVQERVDAVLLHLVQHDIHHRGQAHVQLHFHGVEPPQLDDFYLEYGRVPSAQAYFA
ncbi:MAG: DinB family protein [Pseudomonadota bacterium]